MTNMITFIQNANARFKYKTTLKHKYRMDLSALPYDEQTRHTLLTAALTSFSGKVTRSPKRGRSEGASLSLIR